MEKFDSNAATSEEQPVSEDTEQLMQELYVQAAKDEATGSAYCDLECPDGGRCSHHCDPVGVCWRSQRCRPLSIYGDEWPEDCTPRPHETTPKTEFEVAFGAMLEDMAPGGRLRPEIKAQMMRDSTDD